MSLKWSKNVFSWHSNLWCRSVFRIGEFVPYLLILLSGLNAQNFPSVWTLSLNSLSAFLPMVHPKHRLPLHSMHSFILFCLHCITFHARSFPHLCITATAKHRQLCSRFAGKFSFTSCTTLNPKKLLPSLLLLLSCSDIHLAPLPHPTLIPTH